MPIAYVEPETFFEYRGVSVYRVYKNDDINNPLTYFYTTSYEEDEAFEFDVRDLPRPDRIAGDSHALIIQAAIDKPNGPLIDIANQTLLPEKRTVEGKAWLDNQAASVAFDSSTWLISASESEVLDLAGCDWRGDYGADAVAQGMALLDWRVAEFFGVHSYLNQFSNEPIGFECCVDEDAALDFLKEHRNDLYWKVMVDAGKAVMVEATSHDDLTMSVSKTVLIPALLEFDDTNGECPLESPEFYGQLESIARERIYETTLFDGDTGWEYVGGDSEDSLSLKILKDEAA